MKLQPVRQGNSKPADKSASAGQHSLATLDLHSALKKDKPKTDTQNRPNGKPHNRQQQPDAVNAHKDPLYPLIQKKALFYSYMITPHSGAQFPSLMHPDTRDPRQKLAPAMAHLPEELVNKMTLPKGLAENGFHFWHPALLPEQLSTYLVVHTVGAKWYDKLPDLFSLGYLYCTEAVRDHIMAYDGELAHFIPAEFLHEQTGKPTAQPYFEVYPRWHVMVGKKHYKGPEPAWRADYEDRGAITYIQALEEARDYFPQFGLLQGGEMTKHYHHFNRDFFISLKRAGFSGLRECPLEQEEIDDYDDIGHVF